ncbi:MAG: alpha/beta hydrolase fold domain-containing protein [bacterium]|nr:alpha/beta hydrolase fold domain-containing protein [bacterium]
MAKRRILYLAPGLLCSPRLWQGQRDALEAHFDVRDLLYHAHDRYDAAVTAFLAAAPERFMLAGFSAGGYFAQALATRAPERVSRLALLSTRPDAEAPGGPESRRALVAEAVTMPAAFERVTRETLAPRYLPEARLSDAALLDAIVEMANEIGVAGFRNQQEAIIHRQDSVLLSHKKDRPSRTDLQQQIETEILIPVVNVRAPLKRSG